MAIYGSRDAKADLFVTIILMFSVVLFVGSLYWLYLYGPMQGYREFTDIITSSPSDPVVTVDDNEPESIEEALFELSNENYTIISYDVDLGDRSLILLNFDDFKEKNVNKIVILSDLNQFEKALFIIGKNKVWLWKP